MTIKTFTLGVLVFACIVPMVLSDGREGYDYHWDHPCTDDPGGTQTCEGGQRESEFCWCQGEWDNADHWHGEGYPSESDESAIIYHSNTGYCDGGEDDGMPCSRDGDCESPGTCDNYEDHLKIDLVTETVGGITIRSNNTPATTDSLEVHFNNIGVCNGGLSHGDPCDIAEDCLRGTCVKSDKTLTVGCLILDAANGPLTIKVSDEVANVLLETDTTD